MKTGRSYGNQMFKTTGFELAIHNAQVKDIVDVIDDIAPKNGSKNNGFNKQIIIHTKNVVNYSVLLLCSFSILI